MGMYQSEKNKRIKLLWIVGIIALVIALIPGFVPYWAGLVVFVFCAIGVGLVHTGVDTIPDPEPQEDE